MMTQIQSSIRNHPSALAGTIILVLITAQALILHFMGRIAMCACGFGLWTGNAWSNATSQHFADPYSLSHILHGFIFYALLTIFSKKLTVRQRLVIATVIEIGWELLENSPVIINRYRAATASLDYMGDSILNSVGDVVSCILGFYLAARLPVKWTLVISLLIELGMLFFIRDNLTLNVIMLIYPIRAVKIWQMHGA
ncbi:MAG: hypothetical protein JWM56_213 [Candidatus Peribacteria bacterium]|nr:hypothetical protein [Candidatus Peribacteria bacterium]